MRPGRAPAHLVDRHTTREVVRSAETPKEPVLAAERTPIPIGNVHARNDLRIIRALCADQWEPIIIPEVLFKRFVGAEANPAQAHRASREIREAQGFGEVVARRVLRESRQLPISHCAGGGLTSRYAETIRSRLWWMGNALALRRSGKCIASCICLLFVCIGAASLSAR